MEWRIVFTATFLLLNHNAMSFIRRWHSHNHHFSSFEDSFPGNDFLNSGPDSNEMNSPEFSLDYWNYWNPGGYNTHFPGSDSSDSGSYIEGSPEILPDHEDCFHHHDHHPHLCKIKSTTIKPTKPIKPTTPTTPKIKPTRPIKPTTPTIKPIKPTTPTIKPIQPTTPTTPTIKPTRPIKPTTPKIKPTRPIKPTTPTIKPIQTTTLTTPTIKPIQPTAPTIKPIQPTTPTIKPIQPTTPTIKPTKPTTQSTTETTIDTTQKFLDCIQSCAVTSEYNPVCGTDLITYSNPGRLICARNCGKVVDTLRTSPCPPNTETLPTSQPPLTTAKVPNTTSKTLSQEECIKSCDNSKEFRPLCGSNDVTYKSPQHLLCAQYCGVVVSLKNNSPCTAANPEPTSSTTPRSPETDPGLEPNSTLPLHQQYCIKCCPKKPDHNPVCGTNDVTYKNPSVLKCHIICKINVQLKYNSACPQDNNTSQGVETNTPSQEQQPPAPNKPQQESCIDKCFNGLSAENSKYNPVCGTNNVTYNNEEHLLCALTCYVDVSLKSHSPCPVPSVTTELPTNVNVLTTNSRSAPESDNDDRPIVEFDTSEMNLIFNNNTTNEPKTNELEPRSSFIL